jgi:hypothetical protein
MRLGKEGGAAAALMISGGYFHLDGIQFRQDWPKRQKWD